MILDERLVSVFGRKPSLRCIDRLNPPLGTGFKVDHRVFASTSNLSIAKQGGIRPLVPHRSFARTVPGRSDPRDGCSRIGRTGALDALLPLDGPMSTWPGTAHEAQVESLGDRR